MPLAFIAVRLYVPVPASHFFVPPALPLNGMPPPETMVKFVLFTLASMMQPVVDAVQAPHVMD